MSCKFSVVTISFNQAQYLRAAMESVLTQDGVEIEYIVCDPGSDDGSREIIENYGDPRIIPVFEKDAGPADGLNKGFAHATGDIYCYINSDDLFLPGAFAKAAAYLRKHPEVDVATGHALVVDGEGETIRRVWSEPFSRKAVAHGAHIQIQPSTFFRAEAFKRTPGFDVEDRANWDGSLLTTMYLAGARFGIIDEFLSCYRLHGESITMSGRLAERHHQNAMLNFERLMGRPYRDSDRFAGKLLKLAKHVRWPLRTLERIRKGPLFKFSG